MSDIEELDILRVPAEGKALVDQLANTVQLPQRGDCELSDSDFRDN
jgi:hypothetical protein